MTGENGMLTYQVKDHLSADEDSPRMVEGASRMLLITPSDREALRLLATGHSTGDVAAGLGISTREMETQLMKLFAAMGAATQADAIASAQRRGLLA